MAYAVIVVVIAVGLAVASPAAHGRVVADCRNNLVNLRDHPLWVLLASALSC